MREKKSNKKIIKERKNERKERKDSPKKKNYN